MGVGEERTSGMFDKYHYLDNSSVKIQAEIHGEQ